LLIKGYNTLAMLQKFT